MRVHVLMLLVSVAAVAPGSPVLANDRVDACALAAMAMGAGVDIDEAVQNANQVSFAVPPMVNQAIGIGCLFDPSVEGTQLSRLFWEFPEGRAVDIDVVPMNIILRARFPTLISDAGRSAISLHGKKVEAELAFTCAAWANVDEGRSIELPEIERLTLYGYDLALEYVAINKLPETIEQDEKNRGLYERAPLDFWVGVEWIQANEAVNRGLDHDVPHQGRPYEEWLALRAETASANFLKQDCANVGR